MRRQLTYVERSSLLGLNKRLTASFLAAHEGLHGSCAKGTQDRAWQCIRKFARFLVEIDMGGASSLPRNILNRYFEWLQLAELSESSKQSELLRIRAVLHWCERNASNVVAGPFMLESRNFSRQEPAVHASLSEHDSRAIMAAALKEIDEIVSRLRQGRQELSAMRTSKAILLSRLLELGGGRILLQTEVNRAKENIAQRVRDAGGLKELSQTIFPIPRDLLPFYVAIQFQLAGNPYAIAQLKRDCLESNDLRSDREWVVWDKPRAAKVQRADFPAGKATAAPGLIRFLDEITQPLTGLNPAIASFLFVAYDRGRVALPSVQTWHNLLAEFRHKYNLPDFRFVQLRRTSAVLHHQAAGSILIARQKLNHSSVATTVRYSSYENIGDFHDRKVLSRQVELQQESLVQMSQSQQVGRSEPALPADTVFGFICSDPFAGHVDTSSPGKPCDHFQRCAACPGALIPLDRPDVIAAILKSRQSLTETKERAIREGWIQRFKVLYQPVLDAITEDLIPKVPAHVLQKAESLSKDRPFPVLE